MSKKIGKRTERQDALELANRLLDEPNADPDDDLRMLSRQLLRGQEVIDKLKTQVGEMYDPYDDLVNTNRDALLDKHEEAEKLIAEVIIKRSLYPAETKIAFIVDVLNALNSFHPMHPDSFTGWPQINAEASP